MSRDAARKALPWHHLSPTEVASPQAAPGTVAYGCNGNGTVQHLIGTQFSTMAGVEMVHMPYKGSAPLNTDPLGARWTCRSTHRRPSSNTSGAASCARWR